MWICDKVHTLVRRYVISLYLIILPYRVSTYIYMFQCYVCAFFSPGGKYYIYICVSFFEATFGNYYNKCHLHNLVIIYTVD